ncbi:Uncharacterized protein Fot_26689 [Forsythia ovata]|uniref:EF-hand domain-containing protein n=1 Tax=Forsythia ovata TaxID=205694 RepID=A0ABD1UCK0_9LAMI
MAISSRGSPRNASINVKRQMTPEEFKKWLKTFDVDGDGRISKTELREAIRTSGAWFSGWKSGRGMDEADINQDGYIDDHEIENLMEDLNTKIQMIEIFYIMRANDIDEMTNLKFKIVLFEALMERTYVILENMTYEVLGVKPQSNRATASNANQSSLKLSQKVKDTSEVYRKRNYE